MRDIQARILAYARLPSEAGEVSTDSWSALSVRSAEEWESPVAERVGEIIHSQAPLCGLRWNHRPQELGQEEYPAQDVLVMQCQRTFNKLL